MFLGSMGMDFLFNPEFGMGQSHFYRKADIEHRDFKPIFIPGNCESDQGYKDYNNDPFWHDLRSISEQKLDFRELYFIVQ